MEADIVSFFDYLRRWVHISEFSLLALATRILRYASKRNIFRLFLLIHAKLCELSNDIFSQKVF